MSGRAPTGNDGVVGHLRSNPAHGAVLSDFDGTLAPIVDVPDRARPTDGAITALRRLTGHYALVAVISGRPVSFLEAMLPAGIHISGLYGVESSHLGERLDLEGAGAWREAISDVAAAAEAHGPEGVGVERKGLSLTLHYRTRPDQLAAVEAWAETQTARSGLMMRPARMSVELHPPLSADKGTALRALVAGAAAITTVCYLGDDHGDLAAFDALDDLSADGVGVLRVAVASSEAPAELVERADLVLAGPGEVVGFLESLDPGD